MDDNIPWSDYLYDFEDERTEPSEHDPCNDPALPGDCDAHAEETFTGNTPSVESSRSKSRKNRRIHNEEISSLVRQWLRDNAQDPYPTIEEKNRFSSRWNLTLREVSTLFNNVRRRSQWDTSSLMIHPMRTGDPYLTSCFLKAAPLFKRQTPNDRCSSSVPDEYSQLSELDADYHSGELNQKPGPSSRVQVYVNPQDGDNVENSSISNSSSTKGSSCRSDLTGVSHRSGKRGKRKTITARQGAPNKGHYYCTYCWKNFTSCASWRKHEENLHKPQKRFECNMAELKPTLQDCGACLANELGCHRSLKHNYKACENSTEVERTFFRKDHFLKHLSRIHHADFTSEMESWSVSIFWQRIYDCGYCGQPFNTWAARQDHIGNHYRLRDDLDKSKWNSSNKERDRDLKTINDYYLRHHDAFDGSGRLSQNTGVAQAHFTNIFKQNYDDDGNQEDPALRALRLCWQRQELKEELSPY